MHPVILSFSRLRSSSACGCCVASAATAIASSSSASVEARSVFPERSAAIALLRTMLISHVIGPATEASNPPALCHTFMKASCNTSSARSLLFNIRKATPNRCAQEARYTCSNAARSPSATRDSRAARSSLESIASESSDELPRPGDIVEPQMITEFVRLFVDCDSQPLGLWLNGRKAILELGRGHVIEFP